jgi:hypothetical protein
VWQTQGRAVRGRRWTKRVGAHYKPRWDFESLGGWGTRDISAKFYLLGLPESPVLARPVMSEAGCPSPPGQGVVFHKTMTVCKQVVHRF